MSFMLVLLLTSAVLQTIAGYPNKQQQFALRRGGNVNNYHPDSPCAHLIQAQSQGRIVNRPTKINGEGAVDQLDLAASTTHNTPFVPLPGVGHGAQGYHYEQQYNQANVAVGAHQLAPPVGVPLAPPIALPIVPPAVQLTQPRPPPLPASGIQQSINQQPRPISALPSSYYLNSQTNINTNNNNNQNHNYNNNYNNNNNLYDSASQYYSRGQYATQSQPIYNTASYYTKSGADSLSGAAASNIDYSASSLNSANANSYQQNSGSYASSYNHDTFGNTQAAYNGYAQNGGNSAGNGAVSILSSSGSSNNRHVLDGQLGQVIQETFAQSTLDPSFEKHIYVHVPPEDLEEEQTKVENHIPVKVQKHYNIVFIKAPTAGVSSNQLLQQIAPQTEEKTLVYVLVKKPDEESLQALQEQIQQTAVKSSKPEVYFIKYKTRTEGDQAPLEHGTLLREHITQSSESNNYSYAANTISLATAAADESGLTSGSGGATSAAPLSHSAYGVPLN